MNKFMDKTREELLEEGYVDMQIVPRSEWGALPPKATVPITNHPIANVFLTYHTETMACLTRDECCETLRELQKKHMDEGMDDIAYNFLVGGDGHVYEGRGWLVRPDKSLKFNPEYYENRMDLAYIGDWRHRLIPSNHYAEAALTWGDRGIKKKYLTKYYECTDIREKGREVWDMLDEMTTDEDIDDPDWKPPDIRTKKYGLDHGEMAAPARGVPEGPGKKEAFEEFKKLIDVGDGSLPVADDWF